MAKVNCWDTALAVLPHTRRALLYGPPGTGKTTVGFAGADEPLYIGCHDELSVSEVVGHFIPVGDRFVWIDMPALSAWRKGKVLVIDEIDKASGPVLSILLSLLNDANVARLTIPDPSLAGLDDEALAELITEGEGLQTIAPAPGFRVVATMNGEPDDLPEALRDRFDARVKITEPHPDAIKALPDDLRKAAKSTSALEEEQRRIGLRSWKSFAALREHVGEEIAGHAVFGDRFGDVLDALKLSRDKAPVVEVSVETASSEGVRFTRYYRKTGEAGRPPRLACDTHGNLMRDHTKAGSESGAYERGGHVLCAKCDTVVAEPGEWVASDFTPGGGWVKRS